MMNEVTSYPTLLTFCEFEVVRLVVEGLSNLEIAKKLSKALDTVKTQLTSVYGKLGIFDGNKRAQLVQMYYCQGWAQIA